MESDATDKAVPKTSTILGLRRRQFWTLLVLAILLIGGTIGGSVGGVLAVQKAGYDKDMIYQHATDNANRTDDASLISAAATETKSVHHTSSALTSNDVVVASSPTVTGTSTYPLPDNATPIIDNSCPPTLRSYNSKLYDCVAERNAAEVGDIVAFLAYTMQQCVEACSNMNVIAGSVKCRAVAMTNEVAYEFDNSIAANCWLKSASQPSQQMDNATLAVLITDGE